MKSALFVVDAYKFLDKDNNEEISLLVERDTKAFGTFLNRVCKYERNRGTVIVFPKVYGHNLSSDESHSPSNLEIMDEIEVYDEDVIFNHNITDGAKEIFPTFNDWQKLFIDNDINEIYFGGFHFGRCIHSYVHELYRHIDLVESTKIGIVLNLSMVYPGDSWLDSIKKSDPIYNYYLWGQLTVSSFEEMKVEGNK